MGIQIDDLVILAANKVEGGARAAAHNADALRPGQHPLQLRNVSLVHLSHRCGSQAIEQWTFNLLRPSNGHRDDSSAGCTAPATSVSKISASLGKLVQNAESDACLSRHDMDLPVRLVCVVKVSTCC